MPAADIWNHWLLCSLRRLNTTQFLGRFYHIFGASLSNCFRAQFFTKVPCCFSSLWMAVFPQLRWERCLPFFRWSFQHRNPCAFYLTASTAQGTNCKELLVIWDLRTCIFHFAWSWDQLRSSAPLGLDLLLKRKFWQLFVNLYGIRWWFHLIASRQMSVSIEFISITTF